MADDQRSMAAPAIGAGEARDTVYVVTRYASPSDAGGVKMFAFSSDTLAHAYAEKLEDDGDGEYEVYAARLDTLSPARAIYSPDQQDAMRAVLAQVSDLTKTFQSQIESLGPVVSDPHSLNYRIKVLNSLEGAKAAMEGMLNT